MLGSVRSSSRLTSAAASLHLPETALELEVAQRIAAPRPPGGGRVAATNSRSPISSCRRGRASASFSPPHRGEFGAHLSISSCSLSMTGRSGQSKPPFSRDCSFRTLHSGSRARCPPAPKVDIARGLAFGVAWLPQSRSALRIVDPASRHMWCRAAYFAVASTTSRRQRAAPRPCAHGTRPAAAGRPVRPSAPASRPGRSHRRPRRPPRWCTARWWRSPAAGPRDSRHRDRAGGP